MIKLTNLVKESVKILSFFVSQHFDDESSYYQIVFGV